VEAGRLPACKVNSILRFLRLFALQPLHTPLHQQCTDFSRSRLRFEFTRRGPHVPSRSAPEPSHALNQVRKQGCPSSPSAGKRQRIFPVSRPRQGTLAARCRTQTSAGRALVSILIWADPVAVGVAVAAVVVVASVGTVVSGAGRGRSNRCSAVRSTSGSTISRRPISPSAYGRARDGAARYRV
jgi:hypothetical protein